MPKALVPSTQLTQIQLTAAQAAIGFSATTLLLLALLHFLSPEFDPSWRMVSEYANGSYSWVLSLMFLTWAFSSWALAYAVRPLFTSKKGMVGVAFLVAAGIGEAMAAVFDVNHSLHSLAAFIGMGGLAVAAILVSGQLRKVSPALGRDLSWAAHLPWVSLVLMGASFAVLMATYAQSGGDLSASSTEVATLPEGVIALVGWANRLLILAFCTWVVLVARNALAAKRG